MNALERYLTITGTNEADAMNALQDMGIVSDNCVWAKDVAEADCLQAIEFLKARKNL